MKTTAKLLFPWASTSPANVGDDNLLELVFSTTVGIGNLTWNIQSEGNCEYSDIYGNIINSEYNNGSIHTLQPPAITKHPSDMEIFEGEDANFQVLSTGDGLSFQWQESTNGGINWNNLVNSPSYSGATSSSLHISGISAGMNGNLYRCEITGTCPPDILSNPALLTVSPQPQVIGTTIESVSGYAGDYVIPITVNDCNGVGAISLAFDYDPLILEYTGYQNPHTDLSTGFLIVNGTNGECIISWASITPSNIGNGTLLELLFTSHVGSCNLTWDTNTQGNCEYSDIEGNVILSEYLNGAGNFSGIILDFKSFS